MTLINPPLEIDYPLGKIYGYDQWTPDSKITLCNVPWSNTYKDVVKFPGGHLELEVYLNNKSDKIDVPALSYAKPNEPILLDIPFNRINRYNYIRVINEVQPVPGADIQRTFYYFITGVIYDTPNTTRVTVELDVMQTFGYDIEIGTAFVERGHIGIANQNVFTDFGREYLSHPEGMNIGSEYKVVGTAKETVMYRHAGYKPSEITDANRDDYGYDVIVCMTSSLVFSNIGTGTQLDLKTANPGIFQNLPSGAEFWIFRGGQQFITFVNALREKPLLAESIISIKIIPKINRYVPDFAYEGIAVPEVAKFPPVQTLPDRTYNLYPGWRSDIQSKMPERYRNLTKFLTYPYCIFEITPWSGQPIVGKPESWADSDATIVERVSIMPPNERIVFMPFKYNAQYNDGKQPGEDDGGEYLDFATTISNLPTLATLSNGGLLFMNHNASALRQAAESADWSQQKAIAGAQAGFENNMDTRENASNQALISNGAANDQLTTSLNRDMGGLAINAATGGGGPSGMMNALRNGAGLVNNSVASAESVAISNQARRDAVDFANETSESIANRNRSLANYGAKGDYANDMAALQAKVQDARTIQASSMGQVGGEAFNLVHNNLEISMRVKQIDRAHMKMIGEYWLRFGYAVMHYFNAGSIPVDWHVMSKFTYWKMQEVYIIAGPMPEIYKNFFEGLFRRGVTVWRNPNDIGRTDFAVNTPLGGIAY